ncbi:MAG: copper homeostasis protein CutC, partial [Kaistella sp.]
MLEIACFEMTSAEVALNSMADRIEFCDNLELGGTTPDFYEFLHLKRNYKTPIYVMIRPNGGSFFYSDAEFIEMKSSIISFREAGADGFVFGILDAHDEIDEQKNAELITLAGNKPCTFHRAFDRTPETLEGLRTLIELGFRRLLTSGRATTAADGVRAIAKLHEVAGRRIEILPCGKVRAENIESILRATGCDQVHGSFAEEVPT